MVTLLELGDVSVEVVRKEIKNLHLSVHPPAGRVRISAPMRMNLDAVRVFAISKLGWIRQQQRRLREQVRETPREYLDLESHYVWGSRYLLKVVEGAGPAAVELSHSHMHLRVPAGAGEEKRRSVVEGWYRDQVKRSATPLIAKWEPLLGVQAGRLLVRRMKTKWGSCHPATRIIRLNTELAKKPTECLEYIVVHELVHLIEPTHGQRFTDLMDRFLPRWRFSRDVLNKLPVSHSEWDY